MNVSYEWLRAFVPIEQSPTELRDLITAHIATVDGVTWQAPFRWKKGNPSPDDPVVMVSYREARKYCDWAGLKLPWEAEWELAARGPESKPYPWGKLPPKALPELELALRMGVAARLTAANLRHGAIESFATPRRLAVRVRRLAAQQPEQIVRRRGPPLRAAFDAPIGTGSVSRDQLGFGSFNP